MKRRFSRLPIASIAVVVGSLLIGLSMSPAGAQSGLTNGQVTVRSDGAVYLIANNMRRWVATVVISDEELNAYPEAEPLYAGLSPIGAAPAANTAPAANPPAAAKPPGSAPAASAPAGSTPAGSTPTAEATPDPNDPTRAEPPPPSGAGRTTPTGDTCPASHLIKGSAEKFYYDPERPEYANIKPEACFTAGADARAAGYTEIKKR